MKTTRMNIVCWGRYAVLGVSAWALVCAGCSDGKGKAGTGLAPRNTTHLEHIPLPSGFVLEDSNSEDSSAGSQRWARHWYRGNASVQAVRTFYLEQMPEYDWSIISDQNVKGVISMRFERKGEACTIQVQPSWKPFQRCRIQVVVMPYDRRGGEPPSRREPPPTAP